jgi:hypothetical protein
MFKDLDSISIVELKKKCRDENIHGYSKLKKSELVKLIKTHRINNIVKEGLDKLNSL